MPARKDDIHIGLIVDTIKCGVCRVIRYKGCNEIYVKFDKTGYITKTCSSCIRQGIIKDLFVPSVCGVGFLGGKHYTPTKHDQYYDCWYKMIERCYGRWSKLHNPTYSDCFVCNEWLNFQNFASWCEKHYVKGYQLDKDIKIKGNKCYSPKTCIFVTASENCIASNLSKHFGRWLTNDSGIKEQITNIKQFAIKHNLEKTCLSKLINGKYPCKTYKGWRVA